MTWETSVVRIWQGPKSDARVYRGTGFAIGPDLIMTARHVIQTSGEKKDRTNLSDLWVTYVDATTNIDCAIKDIVWPSANVSPVGKIDVAIARLAEPKFSNWIGIDFRTWPTNSPLWTSIGYRRRSPKETPEWRPEGKLGGNETPENFNAVLHVKDFAPNFDADDWKGCSGAPVIVDNRAVAVLVECLPSAEKVLYAAPLYHVATTKELLDLLPPKRHAVAKWLRSYLSTFPEVRERLAAEFGAKTTDSAATADAVVNAPFPQSLQQLDSIHQQLVAQLQERSTGAKKATRSSPGAVLRILLVVASQCFDVNCTPQAHSQLNAGVELAAELYAARRAGVKPTLMPPKDDDDFAQPPGKIEYVVRPGHTMKNTVIKHLRGKKKKDVSEEFLKGHVEEIRPKGFDGEGILYWLLVPSKADETQWSDEELNAVREFLPNMSIIELVGGGTAEEGRISTIITRAVRRQYEIDPKYFRKG